jgi:hypothetical protein
VDRKLGKQQRLDWDQIGHNKTLHVIGEGDDGTRTCWFYKREQRLAVVVGMSGDRQLWEVAAVVSIQDPQGSSSEQLLAVGPGLAHRQTEEA